MGAHSRVRSTSPAVIVGGAVALAVALALAVVIYAVVRPGDDAAGHIGAEDLPAVAEECGPEALDSSGAVSVSGSARTVQFLFDEEYQSRDELLCALELLDYPEEIAEDFPRDGGSVEWDGMRLVWSLTPDGRGPVAITIGE